jgi:PAS domain S-box-containing protein
MATAQPEKHCSVLIVEDESIVAHDIQQTLTTLGYDALGIASSADEAIAIASKTCPDVALMDIRIKGRIDGIEAAGILQERFGVPIIYLTAHADEATVERAKKTEPYGYLLKPMKPAELITAIEIAVYKHEMDKRLRERERWFSTTLRSIGDAVIAVGLNGRITFMNPVAERLTGWKAEDALGQPAEEVLRLTGAHAESIMDPPLDQVLREGHPVFLWEAGLKSATDSQVRTISDSASPVVDGSERLGAVMVFRDITEQKKLQLQGELTQRLASLGTMAAGVTHEINNPLAVILCTAEILAEELKRLQTDLAMGHGIAEVEPAKRVDSAIRKITAVAEAAKRITNIVRDFKGFARPAAHTRDRADVQRAVEWAISATSPEFVNRARLLTKLEPVPPVGTDETRLGQILVNLLINAAQAIAPGDIEHHQVSLTAQADARGWIVLEVKDSGCGMTPETLQSIFDPFFTTKPAGLGTGLGLSICQGIVKSLGGDLEVESRVGEGSLFRVLLPPASREEEAGVSPAEVLEPHRTGRILVVDDQPAILEILAGALADHEVVCTDGAKEALAFLQKGECFDVIFCDLTMPQMSGIDFYEALLHSWPADAARMIFLTGGATTLRSQDFLRSVPNRVVEKPFTVLTIRSVVQKSLATNYVAPPSARRAPLVPAELAVQ